MSESPSFLLFDEDGTNGGYLLAGPDGRVLNSSLPVASAVPVLGYLYNFNLHLKSIVSGLPGLGAITQTFPNIYGSFTPADAAEFAAGPIAAELDVAVGNFTLWWASDVQQITVQGWAGGIPGTESDVPCSSTIALRWGIGINDNYGVRTDPDNPGKFIIGLGVAIIPIVCAILPPNLLCNFCLSCLEGYGASQIVTVNNWNGIDPVTFNFPDVRSFPDNNSESWTVGSLTLIPITDVCTLAESGIIGHPVKTTCPTETCMTVTSQNRQHYMVWGPNTTADVSYTRNDLGVTLSATGLKVVGGGGFFGPSFQTALATSSDGAKGIYISVELGDISDAGVPHWVVSVVIPFAGGFVTFEGGDENGIHQTINNQTIDITIHQDTDCNLSNIGSGTGPGSTGTSGTAPGSTGSEPGTGTEVPCFAFNTGQVVSDGVDTKWTLDGGTAYAIPEVDDAPGWWPPSTGSTWISPVSPLTALPRTSYTYHTIVTIPDGIDASSLDYTVKILADDQVTDISINGTSTGFRIFAPAYKHVPVELTLPASLFGNGENDVAITVSNSGGSYSGLDLQWVCGCTLDCTAGSTGGSTGGTPASNCPGPPWCSCTDIIVDLSGTGSGVLDGTWDFASFGSNFWEGNIGGSTAGGVDCYNDSDGGSTGVPGFYWELIFYNEAVTEPGIVIPSIDGPASITFAVLYMYAQVFEGETCPPTDPSRYSYRTNIPGATPTITISTVGC